MNGKEKIDYMIQCLELAKDEIAYAESYEYNRSYNRLPNGTIIRENLKMVGRLANIVANEVTLTPYCEKVFKGGE